MRKPTICICETKGADQLRSHCEADQRLFFATRIVQFLYFLNPKFPACSHLLCLYRTVCVRHVRNPHCWFSHKTAHMLYSFSMCTGDNIKKALRMLPCQDCSVFNSPDDNSHNILSNYYMLYSLSVCS